jgi:hypothetical protein
MAVIDPNSVEVLREKVDAWREVEQENLSRYCEILDLLLNLTDEIDGHPANSALMIGELKRIVTDIQDRMPSDQRHIEVGDLPWHLRPLPILALAMLAGAVVAFVTLLVHHAFPSI